MTDNSRVYFRIKCETCDGFGTCVQLKQTVSGSQANVPESCKGCGGSGWFPWRNKPWEGRPKPGTADTLGP